MITESMKVFTAVVELRNFSRAAELLKLSQPSVSVHIKNLEHEMGAKLIQRSPKRVQMTEAGEILYKHAKQILFLHQQAKQEIDDLTNQVTGMIRVGASFTIGEYILPKIVAEYAGQYPKVDFEIMISNTEEVLNGVSESSLDLGLIEGDSSYDELQTEFFLDDEMILLLPSSHPLSQKRVIEKGLLQNQIWIMREQGSGTRTFTDRFIEEGNITVQRSFIFSSSQGVKEAVMAGLGISLLSRWTVGRELEMGELSICRIKGCPLNRHLSFVQYKKHAPSKAMEMFREKVFNLSL
ncbi:transcriptional regulator, LysR family [Bacillus sp. OV322]|uniref:LysR family transcriptional regulator n=1 Tax=Bacillus sp. OV322 TaxID=1882764 RepID=UPI0008F07B88|nr:LysR family transcriptional regulator [Bacillus sp. OV322]SFC80684.1 transcriptional regulator, LysR family [Bacillus sp. OV322]